jgi:hypothetical protein
MLLKWRHEINYDTVLNTDNGSVPNVYINSDTGENQYDTIDWNTVDKGLWCLAVWLRRCMYNRNVVCDIVFSRDIYVPITVYQPVACMSLAQTTNKGQ